MTRIKRRTFWYAMLMGMVLVLLMSMAFSTARRSRRNARLADAVLRGDEAKVGVLLSEGADPNGLTGASFSSPLDLLLVLFHIHKPVRADTSVMIAAGCDNDGVLKRLLDAGGEVHVVNVDRETPLVVAVQYHLHKKVHRHFWCRLREALEIERLRIE